MHTSKINDSKDLFITVPDSFLQLTKSYCAGITKINQRAAIPKRRTGIGTLRFAVYAFLLILLLPFCLIIGHNSVKLNKIKRDDETTDNQQLVPRF